MIQLRNFISYNAKQLVSLGVRLFINLMARHSLLKVIVGFFWDMITLKNGVSSSVGVAIPMLILTLLFGLELGVALIQTGLGYSIKGLLHPDRNPSL